jgi:hypothetical protein
MSSVELATAAGVDTAAVARAIDTVAGIRQFEISGRTPAPLGKSNNYRGRLRSVSALTPRTRSSSLSAGRGRSIWSPSSRARSPPAAAAW